MTYIHHAIIGVGTPGLGIVTAEMLGLPSLPFVTMGIGALVVGTCSIATDLGHPKSFISISLPSRVIRVALAILVIPFLAGLAAMLTAQDVQGMWMQFTGLIFRVKFLRWALIAFALVLGLMLLSWLLHKNLHHRGPLNSLLLPLGVITVACLAFWCFGLPWAWGMAFSWGWLWHILADGLTKEGIPFYWPSTDQRMKTPPALGCSVGRAPLSVVAVGGFILLIFLQVSRYSA